MAVASAVATSTVRPRRRARASARWWRGGVVVCAVLIALPVLVVLASLLQPYSATWQHLAETVLGSYVVNSLLLMVGVGTGTLVLGVGAAWLTAMCQFPGRRFFDWALLLPMESNSIMSSKSSSAGAEL